MASLARQQDGVMRSRIEEYVDDKIQNVADLENVNELLTKVKEQQELLKKQLAEANVAARDAEENANEHTVALRQRAETFQQEQAEVDRRLLIISQSTASDDAVKIFESRMAKCRRLEVAEGYVSILKEANDLSDNARQNLQSNSKIALSAYTRLQALLQNLRMAQPAAEGAAPHLIHQIEGRSTSLYTDMKTSFETTFRATLERMAWPKRELKLLSNVVTDWQDQTSALLDLQAARLKADALEELATTTSKPIILLPLYVMVVPLAQRFRYHFYGERPTNRLDKPEYFFAHTLDLVEQHSPFMTQLLQPILDEHIRRSQELEAIYPDAVSAFISTLLPMVSAKCLSLLPQISSQPQILSHFMHEMMSFDNVLRNTWAYCPIPNSFEEWKGITWDILTTHGYFNTWLEIEKDFALKRYKKIRDSTDSSAIEHEGMEKGKSKPTRGAIRVNDLLETVTDRYRGLSSFSQKMKFLMDVQLAIFDDYHNHLYGALQAYLAGSHTAGRLIQGQSETDAGGLRGLETLVKIFGSAEYLERKMADWSEDLFFLELWEELQDRARRNTRDGSVGRGLTVEEVAAKTSSTITQTDKLVDDEGGALFDETATSYRRLREKSEAEIIRALETSTRNALHPLLRTSLWSTLSSGPSSDIVSLSTSSALDSLLTATAALLGFLSSVIAQTPLRRITRQLCHTFQREIHQNLVLRNTFSAAGAAQLRRDVNAVQDAIDSNIRMPGEARRNMQKLEEVLTLLSLPVRASTGRASKMANEPTDEDDEDGWGFAADESAGDNHDRNESGSAEVEINLKDDDDDVSWGLWEVEKAIFASNESARSALLDMKLELVGETEAREVIRRRIEINS